MCCVLCGGGGGGGGFVLFVRLICVVDIELMHYFERGGGKGGGVGCSGMIMVYGMR